VAKVDDASVLRQQMRLIPEYLSAYTAVRATAVRQRAAHPHDPGLGAWADRTIAQMDALIAATEARRACTATALADLTV
jgi:hypothetical protein